MPEQELLTKNASRAAFVVVTSTFNVPLGTDKMLRRG